MNQRLSSSFARVERRLALMRELAGTLEQAQGALLAADVKRLEAHTLRQRELCDQLRLLASLVPASGDHAMEPEKAHLPDDPFSPQPSERWSVLLQELVLVESRVRHLNQVHAALVQRARRSLAIISRLLAGSGITYTLPQAANAAEPGERR
jgi:hypothetical protein